MNVSAGSSYIDPLAGDIGNVLERQRLKLKRTDGEVHKGEQEDIFEKALKEAEDAVQNLLKNLDPNSECAKWLGPNAAQAFEALIKNLKLGKAGSPTTATGIAGDLAGAIQQLIFPPGGGPPTGGWLIPATPFTVLLQGPFFIGGGGNGIGGYTNGSRGARIVALLHETGHLILVPNAQGTLVSLLPLDGTDSGKSVDNTRLLLQKCSKEIFNAAK
ncbi:MAG: hypothetical protein HY231_19335 [Acidobacteria bacterium]|nr:hypothetical protein [Acidobacteriota bacterium]